MLSIDLLSCPELCPVLLHQLSATLLLPVVAVVGVGLGGVALGRLRGRGWRVQETEKEE